MTGKKEEVLAKIEEYHSRVNAGASIYDDDGGLCELLDSIHENFHHLFEHWAMISYVKTLAWSGYDVSVGTVNGGGCESKEPKDVVEIYADMMALDEDLVAGNLFHIFHIKTEQDYWCCQMWIATITLAKEYQAAYDKSCNEQDAYWRYIPSELFVLAPFLEKYETDPRLTELWSGPY